MYAQYDRDRVSGTYEKVVLLEAAAKAEAVRDAAFKAAFDALAAQLKAGGGDLDTAAVLARINEVGQAVAKAEARAGAAEAEVQRLRTQLASAAKAEADALGAAG